MRFNPTFPRLIACASKARRLYLYVLASAAGEPLKTPRIHQDPIEGLSTSHRVCSHNKNVIEKAVFSNVELTPPRR